MLDLLLPQCNQLHCGEHVGIMSVSKPHSSYFTFIILQVPPVHKDFTPVPTPTAVPLAVLKVKAVFTLSLFHAAPMVVHADHNS